MADARYGRPAITGLDTQHLLYATVKKHRFLTAMNATCESPSEPGAEQEMHVVVAGRMRVMGGLAMEVVG